MSEQNLFVAEVSGLRSKLHIADGLTDNQLLSMAAADIAVI